MIEGAIGELMEVAPIGGGRSIAFSSDASGSYGIYVPARAAGKVTTWADTSAEE